MKILVFLTKPQWKRKFSKICLTAFRKFYQFIQPTKISSFSRIFPLPFCEERKNLHKHEHTQLYHGIFATVERYAGPATAIE